MIECPRCAGKMKLRTVRGVKIDLCEACAGIWLDTLELQDLLQGVPGAPAEGPPPEINPPETTGKMSCPHCRLALVPFEYAGDSGIELDRCPKCQGLWLDAGEWETIERKVGVARWNPKREIDREMARDAHAQGLLGSVVKWLEDFAKRRAMRFGGQR